MLLTHKNMSPLESPCVRNLSAFSSPSVMSLSFSGAMRTLDLSSQINAKDVKL